MGELLRQPGTILDLAASLVGGAPVRRGTPHPDVDAGGCLLFALTGLGLALAHWRVGADPSTALYAGLPASVNTMAARAIVVFSRPTRALASGATAMAPRLPVAGAIASGAADVVNVATWCAVSLTIATVGPHVIVALRRDAARVRRLGQYALEARIGGAAWASCTVRAMRCCGARPRSRASARSSRRGRAGAVRAHHPHRARRRAVDIAKVVDRHARLRGIDGRRDDRPPPAYRADSASRRPRRSFPVDLEARAAVPSGSGRRRGPRARVLRDALRRCRDVEPRTVGEAAGWWRAVHRERPAQGSHDGRDEAGALGCHRGGEPPEAPPGAGPGPAGTIAVARRITREP